MRKGDIEGLKLSMEAAQLLDLQKLYFFLFRLWATKNSQEEVIQFPLQLKQLLILTLNVLIQNFEKLNSYAQTHITDSNLTEFLKLEFPPKPGENYPTAINPPQARILPQPLQSFLKQQGDPISQTILTKAEAKTIPYSLVQNLGQQVMTLKGSEAIKLDNTTKQEFEKLLDKVKDPLVSVKTEFLKNATVFLAKPSDDLPLSSMQAIREHLIAAEKKSPTPVLLYCGQSAQNFVLASSGFGSSISNWWNKTLIKATQLIFKVILLTELSQNIDYMVEKKIERKSLSEAITAVQKDIAKFLENNTVGFFSSKKTIAVLGNLKTMETQLQTVASNLAAISQDLPVVPPITSPEEEEDISGANKTDTTVSMAAETEVAIDPDLDSDSEEQPELNTSGLSLAFDDFGDTVPPQPKLRAANEVTIHTPSTQQDRLKILRQINVEVQPQQPASLPRPVLSKSAAAVATPTFMPSSARPTLSTVTEEQENSPPPVKKLVFDDSDVGNQSSPNATPQNKPVKFVSKLEATASPKRKLTDILPSTKPAKRIKPSEFKSATKEAAPAANAQVSKLFKLILAGPKAAPRKKPANPTQVQQDKSVRLTPANPNPTLGRKPVDLRTKTSAANLKHAGVFQRKSNTSSLPRDSYTTPMRPQPSRAMSAGGTT